MIEAPSIAIVINVSIEKFNLSKSLIPSLNKLKPLIRIALRNNSVVTIESTRVFFVIQYLIYFKTLL